MIDKQEEISFLKRLKKYFKNVQQKDIMQSCATIESDKNCGCFGAHISKCYDCKEFYKKSYLGYSLDYFYDYKKGMDLYNNNTSIGTLDLFIQYGAGRDPSRYQIFSGLPWRKPTYEVLTKVINHLEKETK